MKLIICDADGGWLELDQVSMCAISDGDYEKLLTGELVDARHRRLGLEVGFTVTNTGEPLDAIDTPALNQATEATKIEDVTKVFGMHPVVEDPE